MNKIIKNHFKSVIQKYLNDELSDWIEWDDILSISHGDDYTSENVSLLCAALTDGEYYNINDEEQKKKSNKLLGKLLLKLEGDEDQLDKWILKTLNDVKKEKNNAP